MERKFIPLSVPNIKGNELKYVTKAVEDEWVSTGGSYIETFEKNIANYVHAEDAVAVQSGTAGLHLSLIQSGVGLGDEVIAPTLTFIAAVNPIRYVGAEPVFMDCDDTLCLDPLKLEQFIEEECTFENGRLVNNQSRRQIKAIIGVHVFGNLLNMDKLVEIANKYDLKLIEDATEALGSYYTEGLYKGQYAGTIGDFGVFSFNGNKIMTTGGGGMVLAKRAEDLNRVRYLSTQAKDDTLNFIHHDVGYNYRMTNLQGALGVGQLERLEEFIETKKTNYELFKELFASNEKVELMDFNDDICPNYWFYALNIKGNPDIQQIIQLLHDKKIQTRPIWGLIHQQKPYQESIAYKIEKADYYVNHILNIPCSSNLTQEDVHYVAENLNEIL